MALTTSTPKPLLRREDLHHDPIAQFAHWLGAAARDPVLQPLAATVGAGATAYYALFMPACRNPR